MTETLALFRETGRAHSIGVGFVHKNGRVIDVLLDAVTSYDLKGERIALAALRDRGDLEQWKWATSSIKTLQSLDAVQRYISLTLAATGSDEVPQLEPQSSGSLRESLELATEDLIVLIDDITDHLRQLTEIEEQRFHDEQNSRQVLFTVADTIRVALAGITGPASPCRYKTSTQDWCDTALKGSSCSLGHVVSDSLFGAPGWYCRTRSRRSAGFARLLRVSDVLGNCHNIPGQHRRFFTFLISKVIPLRIWGSFALRTSYPLFKATL